MRSIIRKIAAIMRATLSSIGHAVLVPIRLADGALGYVWRAVTGGTPAMSVEDVEEVVADENIPRSPTPTDDDRLAEIGAGVKRMANDLISHRRLPENEVGLWLRLLPAPALLAIAAADPIAVGKHMTGAVTLRTEHNIVISRPNPDLDRKRWREKKAENDAVMRQTGPDRKRARMRDPMADLAIPRLAPGF